MSELQIIEATLQRAARRRRWARALRGLWVGLLAGSAVWLVILGAYKLWPIPLSSLLWAGGVALAFPLGGILIGAWRKPALPETARWVDVKQNLKERLSTALEIAAQPNGSTWEQLVVSDAAAHVKEIDPRRLVRFSLPKTARCTLLILVLGAGLGFVPEYRSQKARQQQADVKNIKEVGKQLAELTRRSLQQRQPAIENTTKSLESVASLGDQLTKKTLTRSEALKDLASVTDKLKDHLKELGKDPALKKLEQAARSPGGTDSQTAAGLQKQMESL